MSTVDLVEAFAPELCGDKRIPFALGVAAGRLGTTEFGTQLANAQALWAAHFVTMQERAKKAAKLGVGVGAGGAIQSMGTGDYSISWAAAAAGTPSIRDRWLSQSGHGLAFLDLRDSRACSAAFVVDIVG